MYELVDEELTKINDHIMEDSTGMRELRAHLYRLQKLLLSLLIKFRVKRSSVQSINCKSEAEKQHSYAIQITANIMIYIRNQVSDERRKS